MAEPSLMDKINQLIQLINAYFRPLPPRFGDGRYDSDVSPEDLKTGIIQDLVAQGNRIPEDIDLLINVLHTEAQGGYQDDKKYVVLPHSLAAS